MKVKSFIKNIITICLIIVICICGYKIYSKLIFLEKWDIIVITSCVIEQHHSVPERNTGGRKL